MDAEADEDGSHVQAQALQQRHDVAGLQDSLRDQRGDAHWRAVDHQVDLRPRAGNYRSS